MEILKDGQYTINPESIGKGYTSTVFSGMDHKRNLKVAIKRMSNLKAAQEESNFMQNCSPHPFVIKAHDFFIEKSYGYIVMDFHKGQRLGYYKHCQPWDYTLGMQITLNILKGVREINNSDMLHCDITPHNILIFNNDPSTIKIIDFGCTVKKNKAGEYKGKHKGGTLGYMPPELNRHATHLDDSSDLFSTACVCIYLLTGKAPFQLKHTCKKIQNQSLQNILLKATDSNRCNRYRTAQGFIDDLTSFVSK